MLGLMKAVVRAIETLNSVVGRVVAVSLLLLIALVVWEVTLRYVFRSPTTWGNELISYIFSGYILLGGGYTLLHKDHVAMDIVYSRLNPRRQAILDVLTAFFVLIYCLVMLQQTSIMTWEALDRGQRAGTDWGPPLFPVYVAMPIGATLIGLQAIAKLLRDLHMAFTGSELVPPHVSTTEGEPAF